MKAGEYPFQRHQRRVFLWQLFAAAFVLNWVWENAQMAFYARSGNAAREFLICTAAAVGDAVLTLIACRTFAAFISTFGIEARRQWIDYIVLSVCGAVFAVVIEKIALAAGFWSYSDAMLIVPYLNVGLLPFIQLALLMPAALWLMTHFREKEN